MKILFITHYAAYYGANRSLVNMIQGLRALGYEIQVVAPQKGELTDRLEAIACAYEIVPFYPFVYRKMRPSVLLKKKRYQENEKALETLALLVDKFQPTAIYSNSSVFDIGARLANRKQLPHVWHIREMAELHYGYQFYPNKSYFVESLKKSSLIIAISEAIGKYVLEPCGIQDYQVLYNAVFSQQEFEHLPIVEQPQQDKIVFTVVGMLHPSKQQAKVVKAFAQLCKKYPHLELWIAGSGQYLYTQYLKYLIGFYRLQSKVKLLGYLPDLTSIYSQTDIVITASQYEGLGRSTIEGMAYQKAVIGFESGATPELIEHGKRGLLFSDVAGYELTTAMEQMINQPEERITMGKAGREFVSKNFMVDNYAKKLDALLKENLLNKS